MVAIRRMTEINSAIGEILTEIPERDDEADLEDLFTLVPQETEGPDEGDLRNFFPLEGFAIPARAGVVEVTEREDLTTRALFVDFFRRHNYLAGSIVLTFDVVVLGVVASIVRAYLR